MKRCKKNLSPRAGTTMVELLVAFLIVMLMTLMFAGTVTASVNLLTRAQRLASAEEEFEAAYYKNGDTSGATDRSEAEGSFFLQDSSGTEIALPGAYLEVREYESRSRCTVGGEAE